MQENRPLKIYIGTVDVGTPSVEGCLSAGDAKWYSNENIDIIYNWLQGNDLEIPSIKSTIAEPNGQYLSYRVGAINAPSYPRRWMSGEALTIEQVVVAYSDLGKMTHQVVEEINEARGVDEARYRRLENIYDEIMEHFEHLFEFNASAMFFRTNIPQEMIIEDVQILTRLISLVWTQRNRIVFKTDKQFDLPIPEQLYNKTELGLIISRLQNARLNGFFPSPEDQAKTDNLLNESFFKQCAMAFSSERSVAIPKFYVEEPGRVYYWAVKVLNSIKTEVPNYAACFKSANVLQLLRK